MEKTSHLLKPPDFPFVKNENEPKTPRRRFPPLNGLDTLLHIKLK